MLIGAAPLRNGISWTPALSFDTPGTLAVTHSTQWGEYYRIGNLILVNFNVATSVFTLGTAAGNFLISGLPFAAKAVTSGIWSGSLSIMTGVTKATFTQFMPRIIQNTQIIRISASGSGVNGANLAATDTYAAALIFQGSITYPLA